MRRGAVGGIAGAAGLIAILTLLARIAGFGRTLVFADSVRASGVGDIYNAVNAVPNVVHEVAIGGALAALTVPLVAGHLGRGDRQEAHRVASTLLTWALVVLVPLAVLVWLLAEPITAALVGSTVEGGVGTGAAMLRIFALQIPLYGIGIVLSGVLHAHRRFVAVAVAPLLSSVVVIATYAAYGSLAQGETTDVPDAAVSLLAWGTTAGVAALALPLTVPAWRAGWRYRPSLRFTGSDARRSRRLAGAGLIALAAQQAATVGIVRLAVSRGGGDGALSVYTWIQAVVMLPYAVLIVPLATAAFPALAVRAGGGDETESSGVPGSTEANGPGEAETLLARALHVAVILGVVGAVGLVLVSPLVGAVFAALDARRGDGTVSGAAVPAMAAGLRAFAVGLVGFGVQALLTRALYVRGRPVTAGLAVAFGWFLAVLIPAVALEPDAGAANTVVALGVGWSIGMTFSGTILVALAVRHWGSGILRGWRDTAGYLRRRVTGR
ncbi:virulence factor MviN [Nostocoides sp. F2B08]|uniref:murein biosynthesis integral membrane protein MurJ n=1 Tax=Nostocoides sp. F2B08 TaxID=2653936 RepID=UPI001263CFD6|nr:lipid II flippase MurJ [Tetrasphaera sp. F2B08]KAB7744624.1 virulence factor MviN [Tetrasphaera sp. F2B08]